MPAPAQDLDLVRSVNTYVLPNAIQGILIIAAFMYGRIDPALPRIADKVKTSAQRVDLVETTRLTEDDAAPLPLFAVADVNLLRQSLILDSARSI